MAEQTFRQRFLHLVAQLFGEDNLAAIVDDESLISEVITAVEEDGASRHRLNEILTLHGKGTVGKTFFQHFFGLGEPNPQRFEQGVRDFHLVAMMHYGNFEAAFAELGTLKDEERVDEFLLAKRKAPDLRREERDEFRGLEEIEKEHLYLLGYTTGPRLGREIDALANAERFICGELSEINEDERNILSNSFKIDTNRLDDQGYREKVLGEVTSKLDAKRTHVEALPQVQEQAVRNTQRYLSLAQIDVYVAASMREERDYLEAADAIEAIFSHPNVEALKVRFFNPLVSFVKGDRLGKGLLEALMLKRAHAIVYLAQDSDSFGKDSELATMLCQGKPAIVYVHKVDTEADPERAAALDKRYDLFRAAHPLGLQVELTTGLANGVIVSRDPADCAEVLADIFTTGIQTELDMEDQNNFRLKESRTGSIVRVITKNKLLTHAFWQFYFERH